jgi:hypothetical protein
LSFAKSAILAAESYATKWVPLKSPGKYWRGPSRRTLPTTVCSDSRTNARTWSRCRSRTTRPSLGGGDGHDEVVFVPEDLGVTELVAADREDGVVLVPPRFARTRVRMPELGPGAVPGRPVPVGLAHVHFDQPWRATPRKHSPGDRDRFAVLRVGEPLRGVVVLRKVCDPRRSRTTRPSRPGSCTFRSTLARHSAAVSASTSRATCRERKHSPGDRDRFAVLRVGEPLRGVVVLRKVCDPYDSAARIADFAKDNYASQWFADTENGESISIAW